NSSLASAQDLSNLVVALPFHVTQYERRAILFRQGQDRTLHYATLFLVNQIGILQGLFVWRIEIPRLLSVTTHQQPGQRHQPASFSLAQLADREVGCNPVDVSREGMGSLIAPCGTIDSHERLLRQVNCSIVVVSHAINV